ncbi:MAG: hypothetical protein M3004_06770 [Bacteroidota bacterium]|nr:hypothetical protein [Bacteroidota bacterium]
MKIVSLFFIFLYISSKSLSQPSDFIVLKKNNRTLKSFFAGSSIFFKTERGYYSGKINAIRKDSIFLLQYDIRQVPTGLGVFVTDTISTYRLQFGYKEIRAIENEKRKGFNWAASGSSLFGGGVLITAIGLGTWIFTKPGTQYHASPSLVVAGAALTGIGYLLLRSGNGVYKIGGKYWLQYIRVKQ